jgi:hypothetical protein
VAGGGALLQYRVQVLTDPHIPAAMHLYADHKDPAAKARQSN